MSLSTWTMMLVPVMISSQQCEPESTNSAAIGEADCKSAWGTGGNKLSSCDGVRDDYLVLRKSARNLAVCKAGTNVDNFHVGLGFNPVGAKTQQGDGKTPEGTFYISRVNPASTYYKAFVLSYPDKKAADSGYNAGLIGSTTRSQIYNAQNSCTEPPSNTALGGLVEIHGKGGSSDWTAGCIGIEDSQMDFLWSRIGKRDTVMILP